jgi:HAE1 family hydrophobic/amphiphilic exporter-1
MPTIYLAISRQPGTNTVQVVDAIKALLPEIQAQLPAALQLGVRSDRSVSIRDSVSDVKFTLQLTVFLVVMVIFLFLRNLSAPIIPSLALPFSIVGTFAVMWAFGQHRQPVADGAHPVVGFVVDDASSCWRTRPPHGRGKSRLRRRSTDRGNRVHDRLDDAVVQPCSFHLPWGIVGRLMHEFAVTITAAILVSISCRWQLTRAVQPVLKLPPTLDAARRLYNAIEKVFDAWLSAYSWTLTQTIRFKATTMVVSALLLVGTVYLFRIVPAGFIPSVDTGQLNGQIETIQGIGFDANVAHQREIMAILAADPNVGSFTANIGGPGGGGGRLNVDLKPRDQRTLTADQVIEELRPKFARVPGVRVVLSNPPAIRIGGMMSRAQYQFSLQDPDTDELYRVAPGFEAALRGVPGLLDVNSDLQIKNPELKVNLDGSRSPRGPDRPDRWSRLCRPLTVRARSLRSSRRTTSTR